MRRYICLLVLSSACNAAPSPGLEASGAATATPPSAPMTLPSVLASASLPSCSDPFAAVEVRTRVAGEFYLGGPVLCGRGGTNGATCLDTKGGIIWCPITPTQPCRVRNSLGSITPIEKE
jgi:hypothetical protein